MTAFELEAVVKAIGEKNKTSWEQIRVLTAHFVSCFSEEPLNPIEIFPLPWDEEPTKTKKKKIIPLDPEKVKAMEDLVNKSNG